MKALINFEFCNRFAQAIGVEGISLYPYNRLDAPVSCHADMLFCVIGDTVFCYKDYVEEFDLLNVLENSGKKIIFVKKQCSKNYPDDVSLNVLVVGKKLFCNKKYVAVEIIEFAEKNNYKIIDVKQGYAACSTLILDKGYAITSDNGMAKALKAEGVSVFPFPNDNIVLQGYNCGFVGGASAVIGDKVFLSGTQKCYERICGFLDFIESAGYFIEFVPCDKIYDFGGVKFI